MKVKPTTAASLERGNNHFNTTNNNNSNTITISDKEHQLLQLAAATAAATATTLENHRAAQHLQFDSLDSTISTETITIALNSNSIASIEPTKIDTASIKLMRTPPHDMLMWQVVTGAFGSLLRYAQESINVFFCPM